MFSLGRVGATEWGLLDLTPATAKFACSRALSSAGFSRRSAAITQRSSGRVAGPVERVDVPP